MHNIVIGKGGHPFVILELPTLEMIAGHLLEITVADLGRVVGREDGRPAA
jgi:hypothetical protein